MAMFRSLMLVSLILIAGFFALPSEAAHVAGVQGSMAFDQGSKMTVAVGNVSNGNALRGKKVYVDKGCVACHAINGVGGHDAPAMDAHKDMKNANPFDFAAKMWNHAPAMIAAQEDAWGEQIYFNGQELSDIIAFLHDDKAQHGFSEADLTDKARKMMNHEHGAAKAMGDHAMKKKGGHGHAAGSKPHKD